MMPKLCFWITSISEKSQTIQSKAMLFLFGIQNEVEIPGGHLNVGESPEDALIREVKEKQDLR